MRQANMKNEFFFHAQFECQSMPLIGFSSIKKYICLNYMPQCYCCLIRHVNFPFQHLRGDHISYISKIYISIDEEFNEFFLEAKGKLTFQISDSRQFQIGNQRKNNLCLDGLILLSSRELFIFPNYQKLYLKPLRILDIINRISNFS